MAISVNPDASKIGILVGAVLLAASAWVLSTGQTLALTYKVDSAGHSELVSSSLKSVPLNNAPIGTGDPLTTPLLYQIVLGLGAVEFLVSVFKFGGPDASSTAPIVDSLGEQKALSSEARTEMLSLLGERRMTLTELASQMDLSLPGAKRHLETLEGGGLVRKVDEGRKWKYYELTEQGKKHAPKA